MKIFEQNILLIILCAKITVTKIRPITVHNTKRIQQQNAAFDLITTQTYIPTLAYSKEIRNMYVILTDASELEVVVSGVAGGGRAEHAAAGALWWNNNTCINKKKRTI